MKNLIILLFLSFSCFAQTKLDTLVFNKINEYRVSKGLNKVSWDTVCFKASKHHSEYLEGLARVSNYMVITTGHSENVAKFADVTDRFIYFGGKTKTTSAGVWLGEIVQTFNSNFKDSDVSVLNRISDSIVVHWKNSPKHNEIMLMSNYRFGGAGCKVVTRPVGLKGWTNYSVWSTFVFADRTKFKVVKK